MAGAAAILICHSYKHQTAVAPIATPITRRMPKVDRPLLKLDIPEEQWNAFTAKWVRFKNSYQFTEAEKATHLMECCEEKLRDLLIKGTPEANTDTEENVLKSLKALAVIRTAQCIRRAQLMAYKQTNGQSVRDFNANIRASAAPCNYNIKCPHECCRENPDIDYTPLVVRDVLLAGLIDTDIKRDVFCMADLQLKTAQDIVEFVQGREVAKEASLHNSEGCASTAAVSTYKKPPQTYRIAMMVAERRLS